MSVRLTLIALAVLATAGGAAADDWREIHRADGVVVEVRPGPDGAPLVRGTLRVDRPPARVREVLLDLEGFPRWIENLSEWRVLARDASGVRIYGRHALPWPLRDRDYVVRYAWRSEPGDRFVLEARSVDAPPTARDGVVRLVRVYSRWEVDPDGPAASRVRYTYNGELGGRVPGFLVESAWRSQAPRSLQRLTEEVARRDDRSDLSPGPAGSPPPDSSPRPGARRPPGAAAPSAGAARSGRGRPRRRGRGPARSSARGPRSARRRARASRRRS